MRKVLKIIVIVLIILGLAIFLLPKLLGYSLYIISSGSMEPKYKIGSIIYVKEVEEKNIKEGDIITFNSENTIITHRVKSIENNIYYTQGDANNIGDGGIDYKMIIGKASNYSIPYLGYISLELQTIKGKISILILVAVCISILIIKNIFSYKDI